MILTKELQYAKLLVWVDEVRSMIQNEILPSAAYLNKYFPQVKENAELWQTLELAASNIEVFFKYLEKRSK